MSQAADAIVSIKINESNITSFLIEVFIEVCF